MQDSTMPEAESHEYLSFLRQYFLALVLDVKCALGCLPGYIKISILIFLVSWLPRTVTHTVVCPWPDSYQGIPNKLHYVTSIFVNGFAHYL